MTMVHLTANSVPLKELTMLSNRHTFMQSITALDLRLAVRYGPDDEAAQDESIIRRDED